MSVKTNALIKVAVALGYGSASDFKGSTVVAVLKEIAVKLECAASVKEIPYNSIVGVLNYIADNYGSEEKEPYDLTVTPTHATVTVKRGNKTISPAADILYNGDKLKITVDADEGYELTTLTVNGEDIESGNTVIVNGHNLAVVATAEVTPVPVEHLINGDFEFISEGEGATCAITSLDDISDFVDAFNATNNYTMTVSANGTDYSVTGTFANNEGAYVLQDSEEEITVYYIPEGYEGMYMRVILTKVNTSGTYHIVANEATD